MKLSIRRFLAFGIDYILIAGYILLLLGISLFMIKTFEINTLDKSPYFGQIIGFFTLTFPVFLYFYLSEKSGFKGTIGKNKMRVEVVPISNIKNNSIPILLRNIFKFLPWEIAHTGIHWHMYYFIREMETPIWIWATWIIPQVIILVYVVSIVLNNGESSIYDNMVKTKIRMKKAYNNA